MFCSMLANIMYINLSLTVSKWSYWWQIYEVLLVKLAILELLKDLPIYWSHAATAKLVNSLWLFVSLSPPKCALYKTKNKRLSSLCYAFINRSCRGWLKVSKSLGTFSIWFSWFPKVNRSMWTPFSTVLNCSSCEQFHINTWYSQESITNVATM